MEIFMVIIKMKFYLAVEKVLRCPAVFFVRLHRLCVDRIEKAMPSHQVNELLIKMVLGEE